MSQKTKRRRIGALFLLSVTLCMAFAPLLSVRTYAAAANEYPSSAIVLNGTTMYRKGAVVNGEVYVEMYGFMRIFSSSATYSLSGAAVTVYGKGLTVTGEINSPYLHANERVIYNPAPAKVIGNSLWVPLSSMAKAAGLSYVRTGTNRVDLSGTYKPILNGASFYREDEVYWLSKIISAESRGEPAHGQIAVGNVILNRVRSASFPNTIYGVIFDRKYGVQFSPISDGSIYNEPTYKCILAAKACLEGYSISSDILYFYHPPYKGAECWASKNRPYAFSIGGHDFYN